MLIDIRVQMPSKETKEGKNAIQKHIEYLVLILKEDELNNTETQNPIKEFVKRILKEDDMNKIETQKPIEEFI